MVDEGGHILIVEDNDSVRGFVVQSLRERGYSVQGAAGCSEAFALLRSEVFDLVLLDLKLDDCDGMEILRTIRRQDEYLPVIIVSSLTDTDTKADGFDIGCDDYITKPFAPVELIGRVRRLLKRANQQRWSPDAQHGPRVIAERVESGPFMLDIREFRIYKNGTPLQTRKKLFDLMLFFVRNVDAVLSKEVLHDRVWDYREDLNENSLYVHIHQLRSLIEDDPSHPRFLQTVRGVGFVFCSEGSRRQ